LFSLTLAPEISILGLLNRKDPHQMADDKATAQNQPAKSKPAAPGGEKCCVEKCKQPKRAKGYCRKHYMAWRRGKIGKKQRYNTCSKEGCRKPAIAGGVCAEHKKGAKAEGTAPAA
jgi:hypothetical protein